MNPQRRYPYDDLTLFIRATWGRQMYQHVDQRGWLDDDLTDSVITSRFVAEQCGVSRQAVQRWKATDVPERVAESAAHALGVHPASIWPQYFAEVA